MSSYLGSWQRILEIGAGTGALAEQLVADGHEVVAIDSDPAAVASIRARGVHAFLAEWPDFRDDAFDALLFTRSLHHVENLDASIARAVELLRPRGRVIVEDFAYSSADRGTILWFARHIASLGESGRLRHGRHELVDGLLASSDAHRTWHDLAPHVHPVDAIRSALAASLVLELDGDAPYLYRYVLEATDEETAGQFLQAEREAIGAGEIAPIGRRFVAARS